MKKKRLMEYLEHSEGKTESFSVQSTLHLWFKEEWIEEGGEELLGSVVQKKGDWRFEKAWEMSLLHWEDRKGSEDLNCLPGNLRYLHSWRFKMTN